MAYQPEIAKLEKYYSSEQWKEDFMADEAGKLPKDLKRGVLSEDGLYVLLERNRELMSEYEVKVRLVPLDESDREQFIKDNQEAFNYGAMEEFGMRDDHFEEKRTDHFPRNH